MSQENLTINEPGLNVLPPGVERYVINGGGLTGVQIFPEDKIEIINNEGNQEQLETINQLKNTDQIVIKKV